MPYYLEDPKLRNCSTFFAILWKNNSYKTNRFTVVTVCKSRLQLSLRGNSLFLSICYIFQQVTKKNILEVHKVIAVCLRRSNHRFWLKLRFFAGNRGCPRMNVFIIIIIMRELKFLFILPETVTRTLKIALSCSVRTFNEVNIFIEISFEKNLLVSTMFTMEQKIWTVTEGVKLVIQVKIKR